MPQAIAALGSLIIDAANAVIDTGITAETPLFGGVTAGGLVGGLAVEGISLGISAALTPGAPTPQTQKVNVKSPVAPRRRGCRGYGMTKIGGALVLVRA